MVDRREIVRLWSKSNESRNFSVVHSVMILIECDISLHFLYIGIFFKRTKLGT